MPRSRFPAVRMVIVVLMFLLSACATAVPSGDVPSGTEAPTEVVPPTTTEFTGDASTPSDAAPDHAPPIPYAGGPLAGTIWTLESMNGEPPLEGSTITLRFASNGWLGGSDGCNYYSGEVTESPGALRVGPLASTLMICERKRLGKQRHEFFKMLQGVSRWSVEGDLLTLRPDTVEQALVFSPQSQDLSGITWAIESYRDALGATTAVLDGAKTSLTFDKDGTMRGTAGCNDLSGQFTAGDGALQIGPIGMTEKGCMEPDGVMEQELAVVAALEAATTYWVEGDKVQMYQDDGAGVAILIHA